MSANNALHIAVLGGDGIGPEVMAPALEVLRKIEKTTDLKFRFTEAPAGANHYRGNANSVVCTGDMGQQRGLRSGRSKRL